MGKSIQSEFVNATYSRLLRIVSRWTCDEHTARDFVQETYQHVFESTDFDPFRPDAFGFLRRIAWWLWQSHCRRRPNIRLPDDFPSPRAHFWWQIDEQRETVRRAIRELPKAQRGVVDWHLSGMPHSDIASELGLPIEKVYSLFLQAKIKLREVLRPPESASCW
jgi:RNA polymerase sigma factor (sigma-70 family)